MKRFFLALLLQAMLIPLSWAQETTTWIGPDEDLRFLPGSMISFVSNGLWIDEWDVLVRSPAEISNYEGYNVFTAYGNYEQWSTGGPAGFVNPFTTVGLTPGTLGS